MQKILAKQVGVAAAQVNFATGSAHVDYRPGQTDLAGLQDAVVRIGYHLQPVTATPPSPNQDATRERRTWLWRLGLAWPI